MPSRILIVGGGSYIGSNLARSLSQDHKVYATFHRKTIDDNHICSFKVDLTDEAPFHDLKNETPFDVIIWAAQAEKYSQDLNSYRNLIEVNVSGLQKTLDFARQNNTARFIYLSSGSIYKQESSEHLFDENSPLDLNSYYGFSKYIGEKMCEHYSLSTDIKFCCLRLFTVYGPSQEKKVIPNIWKAIKSKQNISLNSGIGMKFNAIYIDDLCNVISKLTMIESVDSYEVYNIANPEVLLLSDICHEIGNLEKLTVSISENERPITYSMASIHKLRKIAPDVTFSSVKENLLKMFNLIKE